MEDYSQIRRRVAAVAKSLAKEKKQKLDELKAEEKQLDRPDLLWHYLLQSFATMRGVRGWAGLIGNQNNYQKVTYQALAKLPDSKRLAVAEQTCRDAKVNYPARKAIYIVESFNRVAQLGGPEAAKQELLKQPGRDAKIRFLKGFLGIGDKYARNMMMDVYHPDFRDSIAIDSRVAGLSEFLGLSFPRGAYDQHEQFYLAVAEEAGLNGWELDRLIFNFRDEFFSRLHSSEQPNEYKKRNATFTDDYPNIASWVLDGWIEIGRTDWSRSFIRALDEGGVVYEDEDEYPTLDEALQALDTGIAEWLEESGR